VQTLIDTELIEFNGWTLRARPGKDSKRFMLLIHGFTGDENSMWVFAQGLSPDCWIIAPRAPHAAEPGGFTWRPIHSPDFGKPSLDQLRAPAEALIQLVDAYQAST